MRSLKLDTTKGVLELSDIVEYVFGFKYLLVLTKKGTLAIDRSTIVDAYRKYKDRWVKINMKTSKKKKKVSENFDSEY